MPAYTLVSTGLTSGFGELVPPMIEKKGVFHLFLARRKVDLSKLDKSKVKVIECDLSSIKSVVKAGKKIRALVESGEVPPIKYFLGNGAIQYCDRLHKTVDGYEAGFQTNVTSYYILLEKFLLELMEKVPGSRVFLTGSDVHTGEWPGLPKPFWPKDIKAFMLPQPDETGEDPSSLNAGMRVYVIGKLAMMYLTYKLAQLHPTLDFLVYNPSIVLNTNLGRNAPLWMRVGVFIARNIPLVYLLKYVSTKTTAANRVRDTMFAKKFLPEGNAGYNSMGKAIRSSELSYDTANRDNLWEALESLPIPTDV